MTLWRYAYCGYPSWEAQNVTWRDQDYTATQFVKALKGRPFNGYAHMRTPQGTWVKITEDNPGGAFEVFGQWAAALLTQLGHPNAALVPVPASDCLDCTKEVKGVRLGEAIRRYAPQMKVLPVLSWKDDLGKCSEGDGSRDVGVLTANLQVKSTLKPGRAVLLDDVATSSAHLRAAARALRDKGCTIEIAICAAQTVWDQPASMFTIEPKDVEAEPDFDDLDSI